MITDVLRKHEFNLHIEVVVLGGHNFNYNPLSEKQIEYIQNSPEFKKDIEQYFLDRIYKFASLDLSMKPEEHRYPADVDFLTKAEVVNA